MKGLSLLLSLLFFSCSSWKANKNIPSWVSHLETGESSMKLELSNEYYFRAIEKTDKRSPKICDQAVDKAYKYVLDEYSSEVGIPYKVMVLYEIIEGYSCAATISVSKQDLVASRKIKSLKKDFNKLKSEYELKVKKELESIEQEKEKYQAENEKLISERALLNNQVFEYHVQKSKNDSMRSIVEQTKLKYDAEAQKVKSSIFYGMKYKDFLKIAELRSDDAPVSYDYNTPCYKENVESTNYYSLFRYYHVCWNKIGFYSTDSIIVGLCDIRNNKCKKNLDSASDT